MCLGPTVLNTSKQVIIDQFSNSQKKYDRIVLYTQSTSIETLSFTNRNWWVVSLCVTLCTKSEVCNVDEPKETVCKCSLTDPARSRILIGVTLLRYNTDPVALDYTKGLFLPVTFYIALVIFNPRETEWKVLALTQKCYQIQGRQTKRNTRL